MIQNRVVVAGHVKIGVAIVIEVADGDALAVMPFAAKTGFFGDVRKRAISIVVIEGAAQRMRRLVNVGGGGLHEEQIHPSVLIVVEPRDTGTHGFEIIFLVGGRAVLLKLQPSRTRDVCIGNRNS